MEEILRCGTQAQDTLLEDITDSRIADQVIFLLGGVGDEQAIDPIIIALKRASKEPDLERKKRIMTAGNLALTNITVADVIWHRGGGIVLDQCPDNPAECWATWWVNHKTTFRVKAITQSRRYSNYPNYGIYANMP
jgi:hypothetical protein